MSQEKLHQIDLELQALQKRMDDVRAMRDQLMAHDDESPAPGHTHGQQPAERTMPHVDAVNTPSANATTSGPVTEPTDASHEGSGTPLADVAGTNPGIGQDPLDVLVQDHANVLKFFQEYRSIPGEDLKGGLVRRICHELKVHSECEEMYIYPLLTSVEGGEALFTHATDDHREADEFIHQMESMTSGWDATMTSLELAITHHIEEEQTQVFPFLRQHCAEGLTDAFAPMMEHKNTNAFAG